MPVSQPETSHRTEFDAVVVGDCIAALSSCFELAQLGLRVALVAGQIAVPERGLPDVSGALRELFQATKTDVTEQLPTQWTRTASGKLGELENYSILGLPASPLSSRTTALIGSAAALRAYLDRVLPVLKIGQHRNLWQLVCKRFGAKTAQTLLAPQLRYRFAAEVTEVSTDVVPGLAAAVGRRGSLADAILALAARNDSAATLLTPQPDWRSWLTDFVTLLQTYNVTIITGELRDHSFDARTERHTVTVTPRGGNSVDPDSLPDSGNTADSGSRSRPAAAASAGELLSARALIIAGLDPTGPAPATLHRAVVTLPAPTDASGWQCPAELREHLANGGSAELTLDLADISHDGAAAQLWCDGEKAPRLEIRGRREITAQLREQTIELLGVEENTVPAGAWELGEVFVATGTDAAEAGGSANNDGAELSTPLYVGAENHGGDLSAALNASKPALTVIRRKLAGIA